MAFQRFNIWLIIISKFTVSAIAYPGTFAIIPNVTITRITGTAGNLLIIIAVPAAVVCRPGLFNKIRGIGCGTPVVPIGAYFSINIEIIQQNKLTGDGMMVRRNAPPQNA